MAVLVLVASGVAYAQTPHGTVDAGVRVIPIRTGSVTVMPDSDGREHVIVKDSIGRLRAESWCPKGAYDLYAELFRRLQAALIANDHAAALAVLALPLRVNPDSGDSRLIRSRGPLLDSLAWVFPATTTTAILSADPGALSCQYGTGVLGDGVLWAKVTSGKAEVFVVNQ